MAVTALNRISVLSWIFKALNALIRCGVLKYMNMYIYIYMIIRVTRLVLGWLKDKGHHGKD